MTSVTTVSPKVNLALRVKRYRPQGRIQIFDDSRNATVPLIGLKVKCQNRFRTVSGITDENGFYQCDGQLLNSAPGKYRIEFDRDKFTLMEGWLNDAEHIGPRQDSDFNHTFQGSGITTYYAKVFYGAHYYFFRDILDLRRPDYPHKGKHRLKIRCHRQPNSTQHGGSFWPKPLQPDVHIHADLLPFSQIFNYTAHEICHASLFTHRSDYKDINAYIDEANAQGVAFFITRILYPAANYLNVNPNYSNYVVDLIDDDEVQNLGSFDANSGDNVNGYTLRQIEDALLAKTINETDWKKNLKDLFVNQTEGEPLDILTNESF